MTSTISPRDVDDVGVGTQDLTTYATRPPVLRRPDATGELPIYRPAGVEELARLSAGETLILPTDAPAHTPRHAVPAVYPQPEEDAPQPDGRPDGYQSRHRAADPPWAWALVGAGALAFGEVVGLVLLAAFR